MYRLSCFLVLALGAGACGPTSGVSTAADNADKGKTADASKGTVVDLDGLRSRTPADWKVEQPANAMRFAQFRLPKVEGDEHDAELVIFKGLGGSARDNVKRWKSQFTPPPGKTVEDVSQVEEMKIGGLPATYLDVRGTYLFSKQPFNPQGPKEKRPDYRLLAVHYEGKDNIYHLRLLGPGKTVAHYKKGFDEWLKNFK